MKEIKVNFYQRITIWMMLGNHQCRNLKETSTFLRLHDKLRLTDDEMRDTQFVLDGMQYRWRLPSMDYGERTVELADDEATALVQAFDAVEGVRVTDAFWINALIDPLRPPAPIEKSAEKPIEVAAVPV